MTATVWNRVLRTLVVSAALAMAIPPALAAGGDARDFYKGKTLRFITMGGPGGGFDTYMRTIMPYLEKRLGVSVLPINESGAGGLRAMHRLYQQPPDGLTILLTFGAAVINGKLYDVSGANYEIDDLVWLGRVADSPRVVLIGPKTPFRTIAEMRKLDRPVIWGGSGKTDGISDYAAVVSQALGLKAKIIGGYKGSRKMLFAVEQGELDAQVLSEESGARAVRSGKIMAMMTLSRERSKTFPKLPNVFDAAKLSPQQAWWLDWRANVATVGRVLVSAPGTPPDRARLLRTTVGQILSDPAFLADAKKRKRSINYLSGDEIESLIKKTMASIEKSRLPEIRKVVLSKFYAH